MGVGEGFFYLFEGIDEGDLGVGVPVPGFAEDIVTDDGGLFAIVREGDLVGGDGEHLGNHANGGGEGVDAGVGAVGVTVEREGYQLPGWGGRLESEGVGAFVWNLCDGLGLGGGGGFWLGGAWTSAGG